MTYEYISPSYVYDGQEVIAPWKGTTGIKCIVIIAAGYHAKVTAKNKERNFERWFHINDLRIKNKNYETN